MDKKAAGADKGGGEDKEEKEEKAEKKEDKKAEKEDEEKEETKKPSKKSEAGEEKDGAGDGMEVLKKYFNGKDSKKKTKTFLKFVKLLTEGAEAAESKKPGAKSKDDKEAKAPESKQKVQLNQNKSEKNRYTIQDRNSGDAKSSPQSKSFLKSSPTRRNRPTSQKSAKKLNDVAQDAENQELSSTSIHKNAHRQRKFSK